MSMDSMDNMLLSFIFSHFRHGDIFFAEDLEMSGFTYDEIRWALSRIVQMKFGVVRLARGVYCIPVRDAVSGKLVFPSIDVIASSLAGRWKVRIVPCGAQAAYLAGFTGIQTHRYTWLSDGSAQVFRLQNGQVISFERRLSLKVFQFRSERMRNLVEGLRYIGKESVRVEERSIVADSLRHVSQGDFEHDVRLAPMWIRELLRCLY